MTVYDLQETDWEKIQAYWDNELPDEHKDETVFQMEPFPEYADRKITFISQIPEVVEEVSKRFGVEENKYWTSIGSQGLKRLTGKNSIWYNTPLKDEI
jgi:hypothetical protein